MFLLWLRQLPWCGDWTPASVPPPSEGRSSPTNTPVFPSLVPLSYRIVHGSVYSFLLVRYSCPLSAGVLHALLCLKVCSWCIHGERGTPHHLLLHHLPTPVFLPGESPWTEERDRLQCLGSQSRTRFTWGGCWLVRLLQGSWIEKLDSLVTGAQSQSLVTWLYQHGRLLHQSPKERESMIEKQHSQSFVTWSNERHLTIFVILYW